MKTILAILFLLIFVRTFGQDYVHKFRTIGREPNVINYQILKGKDSLGTYTTIATIQPKKQKDSNNYSYTYNSFTTNYFKIKTLMNTTSLYSIPIKKINTNVALTNAVVKVQTSNDNLSFNAGNEGQVNYYSIERNKNNSSTWEMVGKLTNKGTGKYVVNIAKSGINRKYRVFAVYKNGLKSPVVTFT